MHIFIYGSFHLFYIIFVDGSLTLMYDSPVFVFKNTGQLHSKRERWIVRETINLKRLN